MDEIQAATLSTFQYLASLIARGRESLLLETEDEIIECVSNDEEKEGMGSEEESD